MLFARLSQFAQNRTVRGRGHWVLAHRQGSHHAGRKEQDGERGHSGKRAFRKIRSPASGRFAKKLDGRQVNR